MTIKDCIDIVDSIKPNQYTIKDKVMWLSFLEGIIINEVLKTHEGYDGRYDNFEGYSEDRLTIPLIVPSPYDRLYTEYLKMMIDKENGEIARYNNSMVSYNTYMMEYRKYYNKTHMPLDVSAKRRDVMPQKNVSVGLSDAEYENLKKDMTYILTEYFGKEVSPDKLYDIVKSFIQTNAEMFKGKDGKEGHTPVKGEDYFTPEDIEKIQGSIRASLEALAVPSYAFVNILGGASNWKAEKVTDNSGKVVGYRYGQIVNVNNAVITENSKVDLQITSEQMVVFYEKDLAFVTENEDGVVTVYCVGNIPEHNYKIRVVVTEVVVNG